MHQSLVDALPRTLLAARSGASLAWLTNHGPLDYPRRDQAGFCRLRVLRIGARRLRRTRIRCGRWIGAHFCRGNVKNHRPTITVSSSYGLVASLITNRRPKLILAGDKRCVFDVRVIPVPLPYGSERDPRTIARRDPPEGNLRAVAQPRCSVSCCHLNTAWVRRPLRLKNGDFRGCLIDLEPNGLLRRGVPRYVRCLVGERVQPIGRDR